MWHCVWVFFPPTCYIQIFTMETLRVKITFFTIYLLSCRSKALSPFHIVSDTQWQSYMIAFISMERFSVTWATVTIGDRIWTCSAMQESWVMFKSKPCSHRQWLCRCILPMADSQVTSGCFHYWLPCNICECRFIPCRRQQTSSLAAKNKHFG